MTNHLIALVTFALFVFGQVHGDCRDYTYDDCSAPGPFETNRDLGTEEVCQKYCNEIYDGTDENPKCEFYAWDNQKKDCSFFDYPMDDYTNSCDGVAGTPFPGLTDCQASTDECLKFKEAYCKYDDANILEDYYGYDLKKCEKSCQFDTRCKYFVHKKNSMNEDKMHCQFRSSKDATCDLELGPSTPSKDQACFGLTVLTENTMIYELDNFKKLTEDKAIIFTVDARNDAHIGFFSEKKSCPIHCLNEMYEIVIGGWANSQSVIRRGSQGSNKDLKATLNILKSNEDHSFWADAKDGLVRLGKGKVIGNDIVMKWQDNQPFDPSYVGFMTGWGSTGIWKFSEDSKEFIGCSASVNQDDYNCLEAIDGITDGVNNGWSYCPLACSPGEPAWAVFQLRKKRTMNTLVMMNGQKRNDHRLLIFRVSLKVDEQWINLTGLKLREDPIAEIGYDGTVTLASGKPVLQLEFNTVSNVQSIRLDVKKTDAHNNNAVVNEIIPKFELRENMY